jgi:hypothetical protein
MEVVMKMEKLKISGDIIYDERYLSGPHRELNGLRRWEKYFRADARSDNYALFSDHLRRLGLPDKPKLLLDGTVLVMQATWVFANLDGQPMGPFLANQPYDPSKAPDPRYIFTFDLGGKAYARVLVDSLRKPPLDLADLLGYPWYDYKVAGFDSIRISHPDWSPLTSEEVQQLETDVTDDLLFDYAEDELNYWFDDSIDLGYLNVSVSENDWEDDMLDEKD